MEPLLQFPPITGGTGDNPGKATAKLGWTEGETGEGGRKGGGMVWPLYGQS